MTLLGDESKSLSIMIYSIHRLKELWTQLNEQFNIINNKYDYMSDRINKINKRLENIRTNIKKSQ